MPDDYTNLPILDDIIKPGDAVKAVRQPSSKVQVHTSSIPDDETDDASMARMDAETGLATDNNDRPDSIELDTGNQTDIDALTEEILANLMHEVEQLLRNKIRQTLRQHFPGETGPD